MRSDARTGAPARQWSAPLPSAAGSPRRRTARPGRRNARDARPWPLALARGQGGPVVAPDMVKNGGGGVRGRCASTWRVRRTRARVPGAGIGSPVAIASPARIDLPPGTRRRGSSRTGRGGAPAGCAGRSARPQRPDPPRRSRTAADYPCKRPARSSIAPGSGAGPRPRGLPGGGNLQRGHRPGAGAVGRLPAPKPVSRNPAGGTARHAGRPRPRFWAQAQAPLADAGAKGRGRGRAGPRPSEAPRSRDLCAKSCHDVDGAQRRGRALYPSLTRAGAGCAGGSGPPRHKGECHACHPCRTHTGPSARRHAAGERAAAAGNPAGQAGDQRCRCCKRRGPSHRCGGGPPSNPGRWRVRATASDPGPDASLSATGAAGRADRDPRGNGRRCRRRCSTLSAPACGRGRRGRHGRHAARRAAPRRSACRGRSAAPRPPPMTREPENWAPRSRRPARNHRRATGSGLGSRPLITRCRTPCRRRPGCRRRPAPR